jgi:hypothetical protein
MMEGIQASAWAREKGSDVEKQGETYSTDKRMTVET